MSINGLKTCMSFNGTKRDMYVIQWAKRDMYVIQWP